MYRFAILISSLRLYSFMSIDQQSIADSLRERQEYLSTREWRKLVVGHCENGKQMEKFGRDGPVDGVR